MDIKFENLKIGEKFIARPLKDDVGDKGFYLLMKIGHGVAISISSGTLSSIPTTMLVIKIL